jgi:hypothetical protein
LDHLINPETWSVSMFTFDSEIGPVSIPFAFEEGTQAKIFAEYAAIIHKYNHGPDVCTFILENPCLVTVREHAFALVSRVVWCASWHKAARKAFQLAEKGFWTAAHREDGTEFRRFDPESVKRY